MKKIFLAVLGLLLAVTMAGCSLFGSATVKKSPAQKQCETFMEDIQYGEGFAQSILSAGSDEGIMHEVFESMEYKVISSQENDDGSLLCKVEITVIDMPALLESLPEDIDSKEAAQEAMLKLADDAQKKTFEAELTLVPSDGDDKYEVQPSESFTNAITGGMYEMLREAFGLEDAQ